MRTAVWLDFGARGSLQGEGYGILRDALFRSGTTPEEMAFFLFGTAVDAHVFGSDWLLEALRVIGCCEAILFRLKEAKIGTQWTAVRYSCILEGSPEITNIPCADILYYTTFTGGAIATEQAVVEPPALPKDAEALGLGRLLKGIARDVCSGMFGR